jgi:hypothetical protein
MLRKKTERASAKLSVESHFLVSCKSLTLEELKDLLKVRTLTDQTNSSKATGQQTTKEEGSKKYGGGSGAPAPHETDGTSKKAAVQIKMSPALNIPPKEVVTRKFFASLKAADMDTDTSGTEAN